MSRMSRRAFLGFRFSEEDGRTRDVPGGVPPETSLPPEFSPAMLRAEAERLGLDPDRIGAGELASAVMRAMYARAPEGAGRTGIRELRKGGAQVMHPRRITMSGQQQIPYLEERKLIKRWSGPWPMLANMAFTLLIFAVTWWVFQDPRGIMRFYTPYVGYNYCRWWLIILIWMAYIFDFWPFRRDWVRSAHPLQKGLVLALVSVGIMIAMIHGFFEGVLGNLAFAYFNPAQLQKLGLTDFYSTEYAAQACMMFAVIASWISPAWLVAARGPAVGGAFPTRARVQHLARHVLPQPAHLFHDHAQPHGILYYPWQYFTAICPPYWEHFAETVSANFHVAWIMCCTVVVWFMEGIWERFPFTMIKTPWLRRLALFFGIIGHPRGRCACSSGTCRSSCGATPSADTARRGPDWRWLHVGETAIFFLVPALFLQFYCGNWPNRFSTPINVLVRSLLVTLGGIAIYCLYYKYAHFVLGTQKGFSHPQQFPMIPMIWLINIW